MIAKRRDVWEKPREEGMASRSNGSGRTSKGKGSASLSRPPEAQVRTHSMRRDKGRNPIQERVGSEKRLIFAGSLTLKGKREDGSKGFYLVWFSDGKDVIKFMGLVRVKIQVKMVEWGIRPKALINRSQ